MKVAQDKGQEGEIRTINPLEGPSATRLGLIEMGKPCQAQKYEDLGRKALDEEKYLLTGQTPPAMILSKDRASGMPYGQLAPELTDSAFSLGVTEMREEET